MKYVDSSAFVKYYSDESVEKGADKVKEIVDSAKEGKEVLISSVLLIGEVISVFDKWLRMGILTKDQLDEAVGNFANDLQELVDNGAIVLEDINSLHMVFSINYIMKHHLTVNDSIHLYSALINRNEIDGFICSDRNLLEAAKQEGFNVVNPEEDSNNNQENEKDGQN